MVKIDEGFPCLNCVHFNRSPVVIFCNNAKKMADREYYLELLDTCPLKWQYFIHENGIAFSRVL